MKYLLDTHILLWFLEDPSRLSEKVQQILEDSLSDVELYVSIVSVWEVAIKVSTGKFEFNLTSSDLFRKLKDNKLTLLNMLPRHVECVETLPFHHRDPFDRLLIATAKRENMIFLTSDMNIHQYAITCIWQLLSP